MREFEPKYIEATRKFFVSEEFPVERTTIDTLDVEYFVIPQDMEPALPDFAMRMTNTDQQTGEVTGIFGVSDSVPAQLRPYVAMHEILEFTQIGISTPNRCTTAEQMVLALIPNDLRGEFVQGRITFFTNLISYFKQVIGEGSDDYTQDDLQEAETTKQMLEYVENNTIDWPLVKKSTDRPTIEKEVAEGIEEKGGISEFLNNFEANLPGGELVNWTLDYPNLLNSYLAKRDREDAKIYFSNGRLKQTNGELLLAVERAIQQEGIDTEKLENLRIVYTQATKEKKEFEYVKNLHDDFLWFALPIYIRLRTMGYSHYDLWM